ncbi:DUF805 domain-containing protein [Variovorax sp. J31P179]|jgi:uncharacterized membrane protein YhaH (DUF805 family)|uniref:DUF805 domain-containing protein n=1 Tax=Variovorax sp. J31P179 TaxID=3053508 RepID=UPI0025791E2A|nr:DUF805 domain-containing protein [Variovorax sp. J31P179]MDM0083638.1 DUF805 domain-containing protein [Variovorax sp. J31P179]
MSWIQEFSLQGRLSRTGFWLRMGVVVPVALWLCTAVQQRLGAPFDLIPVLALVGHLVSVWGRRLHDRGRSAAWLLLAAVPVAGAIALLIECGFRGPAANAERYGAPAGVRSDYLRVTNPATDPALP